MAAVFELAAAIKLAFLAKRSLFTVIAALVFYVCFTDIGADRQHVPWK